MVYDSGTRCPRLADEVGAFAMTNNDNADYYLVRAEQEEQAALQTTNALAAAVHSSLAERYRAKACECEEIPQLRLVRD
jgi:hypothetical protein